MNKSNVSRRDPNAGTRNDVIIASIQDVIEVAAENKIKTIELDMTPMGSNYGGGWILKATFK